MDTRSELFPHTYVPGELDNFMKTTKTFSAADIGVIGDVESTCLSQEDMTILTSPALSGVILFARNYENPEQLKQLTNSIRAVNPNLAIFADQEGGRVQRFREGFTRLPPMMKLGNAYRTEPALALSAAKKLGALMAAELFEHGVDVSFAPVLDIERGCSRVIGDRAFGTDSATVSLLAEAFVKGMADIGMPAVGKHFPGHGAVEADSHLELPSDGRYLSQLDYDMRPFRYLNEKGLLQGIMPAHVLYPAVDSNRTAGFSPRWLTMLREEYDFDGVIFSDDLTMQGAAEFGSYSDRARVAVEAGCNALVVCNKRSGVVEILEEVEDMLERGYKKLDLSGWKSKEYGQAFDLEATRQWLKANEFLS